MLCEKKFGKLIFQQNDMIIKFGVFSEAMSFSNCVLFRPHRTLEHTKILTSRPPVALTEHLL